MKKIVWALALTLPALNANASPADYIYTPHVERGEKEIDLKLGQESHSGDKASAGSLGLGYGLNDFWFSEIYGKWEGGSGEATKLKAFEWENKFQLTPQGKYPVDIGLVTELEVPRDSAERREFKIGSLFQTDYGRTQLNANLLLERKFGGSQKSNYGNQWEAGYQWQIKYRARPVFEYGLQGFGNVGPWNDWAATDKQEHLAGPAVFGHISLSGRQKIVYNAALLAGLNKSAPDYRVRFQGEYEF